MTAENASIRFSDLGPIRALIDGSFPETEFNMEGYPEEGFLRLVEEHRPEQVTLVPDDPSQATSDHGWDFRKDRGLLEMVVGRLKGLGLRVSLFADGELPMTDSATKVRDEALLAAVHPRLEGNAER